MSHRLSTVGHFFVLVRKTEWIPCENLSKRSHSRHGVDRVVCYDRATEKTVIDLIGEDQQGSFRNIGPMQILRQLGD